MIESNPDWNTYIIAILACLLALSEALALIPGLKSNSILSMIINILRKILGKENKK